MAAKKKKPSKHANSTSWKPGRSANPGGRPRTVAAVRELANKHTEAAINVLVEVMQDKTVTPHARVAAANAVLDRGHGKPSQPIEFNPERMTVEELDNIIDLELKRRFNNAG